MSVLDTSSFSDAISKMQATNNAMLQFQEQSVAENRRFSIESTTLEHEASVTERMQGIMQTLARNSSS
ncbi:hypothetical protein [uncultured Thiothrix sp.]|jgi:hypothetical protein|uniref:hypothetical protein n=1 Tax=uncultured Thiothrix sp. TaxID=223185 RepID=UPI0026320903|nr:hypothetical protein [uncultured Thiothrix sp.]HMT92195.1 hypothetical protein [Thiolinea sp.]